MSASSRSLALSALSIMAGCSGETQRIVEPVGSSRDPLYLNDRSHELIWATALPAPGSGIAVHPLNRNLYVTVGPGGESEFRQSGGLIVLSSSGESLSEISLQLKGSGPSGGASSFNPNAPLIHPDGGALYVGDSVWNAFFYSTTLGYFFDVRPHGNLLEGDRLSGISASADFDVTHSRVLIPGRAIYRLDMSDGEIQIARELEAPARQIIRVSSRRYLVSLISGQASQGRIASWNPMSDRIRYFSFPTPIHWLASSPKWVLALGSEGDHCVISEIKWESGTKGVTASLKTVGEFRPLERSGCETYRMIFGPESRRILVSGEGRAFAIRTQDGQIFSLAVEQAHGIALSPDESTAYVLESRQVKAFDLNERK